MSIRIWSKLKHLEAPLWSHSSHFFDGIDLLSVRMPVWAGFSQSLIILDSYSLDRLIY